MEATAHITANIHITTINFFADGHYHDVAQEMQSIIFVLVSAGAMYVITPPGEYFLAEEYQIYSYISLSSRIIAFVCLGENEDRK